jgi:VanZ family protein
MMTLIFIASGTPGEEVPTFGMLDILVKKGGHMAGYAMLAAACFLGAYGGGGKLRRPTALSLGLAVAYAASDECHQLFTPGRSPAVTDVAIDAVGALAGVALVNFALRRRFRRGRGGEASA